MAGHFAFEEEKLPEKVNLSVWLKVLRYAKKEWKLVVACLLTTVFVTYYDSSFIPLMNAAAIQGCTDAAESGITSIFDMTLPVKLFFFFKVELSYAWYAGILVIMLLIRAAMVFLLFYTQNILSMKIMNALREDTFEKIQLLPFSYFDRNSSGWLIARMQNDTASIGDVVSNSLNSVLWAGFDLAFTIITMFMSSWMLSLVVLASIPLVAIIVPIFERLLLTRHRTARAAYSHYVGWLAEAIDGAKTIKTLSVEDQIDGEAKDITEDIRHKRWRAMRVNAFFSPLLELISSAMIAIIVGCALSGLFPLESATLPALMVLFVGFVQSIYSPLQAISEVFGDIMASQAGAEKVMQLLEAPIEIVDTPEVIEKYGTILNPKKESYEPLQGDIVFDHVSFSYNPEVEVIHDLCLHVKKGTSLAIVGETGSGKTTTVNLLCRFYEPTSGRILVDGVDYKERSLGYLRSNIGYVQQTPFVFEGTFYDNIVYGNRNATREQVEEAARIVGIDSFIRSTKDGYDTYLHDGGGMLSQGQKQLVSFARALLRDPSILILDEATSSIDTETEASVQKAIGKLLQGRTSITIAHRLSTIVDSDRILVMDKGRVVEDGDHKSLMEKKGAYYSLYMNQFKELSIYDQEKTYQEQIEDKGVKL